MPDTLIPAPQSMQPRTGWFRFGPPEPAVAIRSDNAAARTAVDWLVQRLKCDHGMLAVTSDGPGPVIHLRVLSPAADGKLGCAMSPAFATAAGQEQGYILDVHSGIERVTRTDSPTTAWDTLTIPHPGPTGRARQTLRLPT